MKNKFLTTAMIMVVLSMSSNLIAQQIQSAGSLEFSPTGTLFVGDNIGGAGIIPFRAAKTNPEKIWSPDDKFVIGQH